MSKARLEAFSDGVIAIAATLLILEVHKPDKDQSIWTWLHHDWVQIDAYAIAFLTIGIMWVNHHMLFHLVRRVDRTLLFLNLGLLAMIAFLPLPTATAGERYHDAGSIVFFSVSFGLTGLWFVAIWWYLHRHPELVEPEGRARTGPALRRTIIGPLAYGIAALIAVIAPEWALGVNALIALYFVLPWTKHKGDQT
jgi:uncharacterized membrane protein